MEYSTNYVCNVLNRRDTAFNRDINYIKEFEPSFGGYLNERDYLTEVEFKAYKVFLIRLIESNNSNQLAIAALLKFLERNRITTLIKD